METTSTQPKTITLRSRSQITGISPFSSIGVNGLPDGDVLQNASAVETGMPRPEGVLASGLAQPRDEGQNMQDEVSTVPLTDEPTLAERQRFEKWIDNLHVHYHNQQTPFTQKKNGWIVSQVVRVSSSPLGDSGHANPIEQKDRRLYAFVQTWSRNLIYWTMDLDGRQAIVVPIVDGPRAAFVEWTLADTAPGARTAPGQRSQPNQHEKPSQSAPPFPAKRRRQETEDNDLAKPGTTRSRTGQIARARRQEIMGQMAQVGRDVFGVLEKMLLDISDNEDDDQAE
ncbi:MAG: hypothetical protein Q9194_001504 [Teloschistes cf. exilis]